MRAWPIIHTHHATTLRYSSGGKVNASSVKTGSSRSCLDTTETAQPRSEARFAIGSTATEAMATYETAHASRARFDLSIYI